MTQSIAEAVRVAEGGPLRDASQARVVAMGDRSAITGLIPSKIMPASPNKLGNTSLR